MAKRNTKIGKQRESKRTRQYAPLTVGGVEKFAKAAIQAEVKAQAALVVRPVGRPPGSKAFQSVMRAKELLAESSVLAVKMIRKAGKVAAEKGDSAPAEFLLKHASATDAQGKTVRPVSTSVDKLEGEGGSRMPTINIGWIGGNAPAVAPALPGHVIDVRALPEHTE